MRSFTTADLNKRVGSVADAAMREPVVIAHHRKPRFVRMSVESAEHGRQARLVFVVVPLTCQASDVVLFPLSMCEPGPDQLAVKVPEAERRRLRLRDGSPSRSPA
jgi:hypothetical protein